MPPWPASTKIGGPFIDERVLTQADIATLKAWSEAGSPEGDVKDAPEPRKFASDWPLGTPDLVLTMPEPYELTASGDDDFRVFVLKTNFKEDRWIRAVDFKPGNRRVVHHVISGIDASGKARELDAKDAGPGYRAPRRLWPWCSAQGVPADLDAGEPASLCSGRLGLHFAGRGRRLDSGPLPQIRQTRDRRDGDRPLSLERAVAEAGPHRVPLPDHPAREDDRHGREVQRDCQGRQAHRNLRRSFTMSW